MDSFLKEYLKSNNVNYVLHKHKAVFTVNESKKIEKGIPGMHCKTLFMKDEKGRFYLIGMKADTRLDVKSLEDHFSVGKLRFASKEELKENLNVSPGSVSIFNIINSPCPDKIILVITKDVWGAEIVGFHPNINTETLELSNKDLKKYYDSIKSKKEVLSF